MDFHKITVTYFTELLQSGETDGIKGDWGCVDECPRGQYVYAYSLRSEPYHGVSDDDTALNAVKLYCSSPPSISPTEPSLTITSTEGQLGEYSGILDCVNPDDPIVGFKMKIEGHQGYPDDTAANKLDIYCQHGSQTYSAITTTDFGNWTSKNYCPQGQAVTGIQTRVESPQGADVDDTALNGVRLVCRECKYKVYYLCLHHSHIYLQQHCALEGVP